MVNVGSNDRIVEADDDDLEPPCNQESSSESKMESFVEIWSVRNTGDGFKLNSNTRIDIEEDFSGTLLRYNNTYNEGEVGGCVRGKKVVNLCKSRIEDKSGGGYGQNMSIMVDLKLNGNLMVDSI